MLKLGALGQAHYPFPVALGILTGGRKRDQPEQKCRRRSEILKADFR